MAWIESHQQLERHPKTHELMRLMGWDLDTAIGKLHRFWWWCLDYAATGDLNGKNDVIIAGSVGLVADDAKRFVDSMVASSWIDRDGEVFRVHDWIDYAGRYLKESKFKRHPKKQRELNNVYRPRTVRGKSKLPDQTRPDLTKPQKPPHARAHGILTQPKATRDAAMQAFSRWSALPPPTGRGHEVDELRDEHTVIFNLVEELAILTPIPRANESVPRQLLIPQAVECCSKDRKPFRDVRWAIGCVRTKLNDWSIEGVGANGRAEYQHNESPEAYARRVAAKGAK